MKDEGQGLKKFVVFGGLWLFGGVANLVLMGYLTDAVGIIPGFVKFMFPALGFVATTRWINTRDGIKQVRRMIKERSLNPDGAPIIRSKQFGIVAIPITAILFLLGGLLTSLWTDNFKTHMILYTLVGTLWGVIWYQMLNNKFVNTDFI